LTGLAEPKLGGCFGTMDLESDPALKKTFRLFRARETIVKMLTNRKYVVNQEKLSFDDFKSKFGHPVEKERLTLLCVRSDDPNKKIFVFFPGEEKVDVKALQQYADKMQEQQVYFAIIVVENDMSPFAKKALEEAKPQYNIEVFKEAELQVDITEHELVPKHEVLTDDEKQQLLKRYNLKDSQLPRMFPKDPISRYFGLQRGQVVKIIRSSETAGRYISYRVCM